MDIVNPISNVQSSDNSPEDTPMADQRTPSAKLSEIIARLAAPRAFNIRQHRVDDFRDAARRSEGAALQFTFGKPSGMGRGVLLLVKHDAHHVVRIVVRRLGKTTRFALPTPEFAEPELNSFREPIHLIAAIDATGPTPAGVVIPNRITTWIGYTQIFDALLALNDETDALWLRYRPGTGADPGGYEIETVPMRDEHKTLRACAPWPVTEAEILALIPSVAFEELIREDFNLQLAWSKVLRRRGTQP